MTAGKDNFMENKQQKKIWLYPQTETKIKAHLKQANCASDSEFVEKAINFYCGYLTSKNDSEFLPKLLLNSIDSLIETQLVPVRRLLFKEAVELNKLSQVIATSVDIDEITLSRLQAECQEEVSHINGILGFEKAYQKQRGGDFE